MKILNYRKSKCRGCNLEIIWLRNVETNKAMPIDPLPTPNGNIVLLDDGHSFRVLTKVALDIYKQSGGEVHISHFATCVCADDFRPKKAA